MSRSPAPPPEVRPVGAEQTRSLRHSVLRPSSSFETTVYPKDDDPETRHFGAFEGDRLVGIASLYREDRPGAEDRRHPGAEWRLRGMATAPDDRGRGAGRTLLAGCVAHVAATGGGLLWCNARVPAVGFYRAGGLEVEGDEFDIPGIGPHVVMVRAVP